MAISRLSETTLQTGFQKFNTLWDGRSAVGAMDAISSVRLTSAQSHISFNNIPQTYTHLQVRIYANVGSEAFGTMTFNDVASNYQALRQFYGSSTNVVSNKPNSATSYAETSYFPSTTNVFSSTIIDILDYSNTNKHKTVKNIGGWDNNTLGYILTRSALWATNSAITVITFAVNSNATYSAGTTISLYGIR